MTQERLSEEKGSLFHYFCGLCMGLSDLIPGISGGTVAYILGFYGRLIDSISAFALLFKRPVYGMKQLWKGRHLHFLSAVFLGDLTALILFSSAIRALFLHEVSRSLILSFLVGIVGYWVFSQVRKINFTLWRLTLLALGAAFSFVCVYVKSKAGLYATSAFNLDSQLTFINLIELFVSGVFGAIAMLLPGISGTTLLIILGTYPKVITALATFSQALTHGEINSSAGLLLAALGLGVFFGMIAASRAIRFCFRAWGDAMLATIVGFVIGGAFALWPFWGDHQPKLPTSLTPFLGAILLISCGAFISFAIEKLQRMKEERRFADLAQGEK